MNKQQDENEVFGAPPLSPSADFDDSCKEQEDNNTHEAIPGSEAKPIIDYKTAEGEYAQYLRSCIFPYLKYIVVFILVGVPLAIPIIIYRDYQDLLPVPVDPDAERRQFRFYLFYWLEISWLALCLAFLLGTALPYIFRFVAR